MDTLIEAELVGSVLGFVQSSPQNQMEPFNLTKQHQIVIMIMMMMMMMMMRATLCHLLLQI